MRIPRVSDASATEQESANTPTAPSATEHTKAHVRDADARLHFATNVVTCPRPSRDRSRSEAATMWAPIPATSASPTGQHG
jgi:hypothetical protein